MEIDTNVEQFRMLMVEHALVCSVALFSIRGENKEVVP